MTQLRCSDRRLRGLPHSDFVNRILRSGSAWLALLVVLPSCGDAPPPPEPPARPVKTLRIGGASGGAVVEHPGVVSAAQQADLAFEVPGRILELPVTEGMEVSAGSVLARLDPRDFQDSLDAELARERVARSEYDAFREMYEKSVKPKLEVDRKQRNFEMAEASVRIARKALEDAVLRAPFDGTVAKKLVDDFANVQAKQPVLILQDTSSLEVILSIPEIDFARGDPSLSNEERTALLKPVVVVSTLPGRSFPATIREYSTTADPATRTYSATLRFERSTDALIMPGMSAKVRLTGTTGSAEATFGIPATAAIADESGAAYVWRVDPQSMTVSRAAVALGALSGSLVEVQSGLGSGDEIVTSGMSHLREGLTIRRYGE